MRDYNIIVDTREQKPLFKNQVINKKLDTGDYSIEGYEDKIAIERKSPTDLYGTLTHGHERFKKELQRSQTLEYFVIIVDASYTSIIDKEFEGSEHIKTPGEIIIKIIHTIQIKYKINIIFSNGRIESKRIITNIFNAYKNIKKKEKGD